MTTHTKKQRIVHLTSVHARYDNRILYKQCISLHDHGYEVYLIVADGKGDEVFRGVYIVDVGKKGSFAHRLVRVIRNVYKEAKKLKGDIYQIHDPELLPIAFMLHRKGKQVIYDVHEDYHTSISQKKYLPYIFKKIFLKIYGVFEEKAKRQLTILLAEKYYKQRFPNGHLVLNYPIIIKDHVNTSVETPSNKLSGQTKKLLYTGNVTEDRGALTQSIIVDKIDDVSITFVGRVSEPLANRMIASIKNQSNIELVGVNQYIPQTEIQEFYQTEYWLAGLAIFPKTAHYEQKELTKFFEYMLNSLPIICTDFPAWKDFVEKNQCGFAVDPNNYTQIEDAVNQLANDPDLRKKMGENGKARVLDHLNWETQAKTLLRVYESLSSREDK